MFWKCSWLMYAHVVSRETIFHLAGRWMTSLVSLAALQRQGTILLMWQLWLLIHWLKWFGVFMQCGTQFYLSCVCTYYTTVVVFALERASFNGLPTLNRCVFDTIRWGGTQVELLNVRPNEHKGAFCKPKKETMAWNVVCKKKHARAFPKLWPCSLSEGLIVPEQTRVKTVNATELGASSWPYQRNSSVNNGIPGESMLIWLRFPEIKPLFPGQNFVALHAWRPT